METAEFGPMMDEHRAYMTRAAELAALVQDGSFTADEAALSLAGWSQKRREESGGRCQPLQIHQLTIDQLVPGYAGLIPGRHI